MGPTGPTSSWRPFGPAFGPSALPLSNFGAAVDSVLARFFGDGAAGGIPYSRS